MGAVWCLFCHCFVNYFSDRMGLSYCGRCRRVLL